MIYFLRPSHAEFGGRSRSVAETGSTRNVQSDVLYHYQTTLEGECQGVGRTYQRIRDHFHRRGLYQSVHRYAGECVDCEIGKAKPVIQGESPENLQAAYPFQIIAMDHIPPLHRSYKGNTELLIWVDLFTGYMIAKASASRSAQTVAESYEECVFRQQDPGTTAANDDGVPTSSQRDRGNNGVQTATRALQMYVRDLDQKNWVEWDPRPTLETTIPVGCTRRRDRDSRRWRYRVQRLYQQSREAVNARLREAIGDRDSRHNEDVGLHLIEAGSRVWLYLDRVVNARLREAIGDRDSRHNEDVTLAKLAHLWHGPFRVAEKINEFTIKLEIAGTGYPIFPVVHVDFPDRPRVEFTVHESDRFDFDEVLLPEDSWVPDPRTDDYEGERISDVRSGKKERFGRVYRNFWCIGWDTTNRPESTKLTSTAAQC
ncbi:reverse transcriptase [Phytophthora megakarya]|uniref:Reverse transcriptase n=1 Tax=Phytophthora megakarya TaxID=4795 RepID=A0A225VDY5_9STRA|nr:reverse transcriptase [Phytophthora megakarya]